jgi:AraC-like DNA-binding protein
MSFHPCHSSRITEERNAELPATELSSLGAGRQQRKIRACDARWQPPRDAASSNTVATLSEAFAAAERDQSDLGAICTEAIRLAASARILGIHTWPDLLERQSQDPSQGLSKWRLKRVMSYVAEHIGDKVTLADMAAAARLSRMHFAALFLRATGLRPHEYLLRQRVGSACELLLATERPIVEIALSVGFQTQAHFTTVFKRITGSTPARWREHRRAELNLVDV